MVTAKQVAAIAVSGVIMFAMSACGERSNCIEEGSFLGTKVADAKPSSSSSSSGSRASSPSSSSSKSPSSGSKQGSGFKSSKGSKSKVPKSKIGSDDNELDGNQQFNNARGNEDCD